MDNTKPLYPKTQARLVDIALGEHVMMVKYEAGQAVQAFIDCLLKEEEGMKVIYPNPNRGYIQLFGPNRRR